jgi:hypothetical protein
MVTVWGKGRGLVSRVHLSLHLPVKFTPFSSLSLSPSLILSPSSISSFLSHLSLSPSYFPLPFLFSSSLLLTLPLSTLFHSLFFF